MFHNRNTLFYARGPRVSDLLGQLYRLQNRIRFVQDSERRRDTVPEDLVEVDREFQEKVQAVAALKSRLDRGGAREAQGRGRARGPEGEAEEVPDAAAQRAVQPRVLAALNEIDGVEKLIRSTEDRFLELEEEIEKAQADLDEREKTLPAETEEHEERLKDWRAEQRTINEELAGAREEIAKLEAEIPPRDRAEFRRLIDKKHGLAVALVVDGSCSACHVQGPAGRDAVLKQGREIVYCDSCKRILYYDPRDSS